jgi:ribosome-associated heat shock protein Hsp15
MSSKGTSASTLRIDRWLFFCRFFRTRSLATAAVTGGHVRLNGERASPGNRVQCGDRIELVRDRLPFSLEVVAIPSRRGPASEAQACYTEDETVKQEREARAHTLRQDRLHMPRTDGRPDKRTRRQLIRKNRG